MQSECSEASSGDGQVKLRIDGAVAHIQFDRPWARNAMTWAMYDGLAVLGLDQAASICLRPCSARRCGAIKAIGWPTPSSSECWSAS
jgi:hypothetical protein